MKTVFLFVLVLFISNCYCLSPGSHKTCVDPDWAGDGICDDATNTEECDWDGGDCCKSDSSYEFCEECQCKEQPETNDPVETPVEPPVEPFVEPFDELVAATKKPESDGNGNYSHCVDVSEYKPVVHTIKTVKFCWPTIVKKNHTRDERVCCNVTDTICDIKLYQKCQTEMFREDFNGSDIVTKEFPVKECRKEPITKPHIKSVPECHNETRHNCVTKWDILPNGEKVWTGKYDCSEVYWTECKLVNKTVNFTTYETNCTTSKVKKYIHVVPKEKSLMLLKTICDVEKSEVCEDKEKEVCKTITLTEVKQEIEVKCEDRQIPIPEQVRHHLKKCIFPHSGGPKGPRVDPGIDNSILTGVPKGQSVDNVLVANAIGKRSIPMESEVKDLGLNGKIIEKRNIDEDLEEHLIEFESDDNDEVSMEYMDNEEAYEPIDMETFQMDNDAFEFQSE